MPISVASPRSLAGASPAVRALVKLVFDCESRRAGEVDVSLADDALLRELNKSYRGKDQATDVLSFPYHERDDAPIEGDIVISLERVAEQAKRFGVSQGQELARLVIHGALHLAGHDHHVAAERTAMRAREDRVMREGAAQIVHLDRAFTARARDAKAPVKPAPPAKTKSKPKPKPKPKPKTTPRAR
jgi:probable rRNA maturation factor